MVELIKSGGKHLKLFEGVRQVAFAGVHDIYAILAEEQRTTNLSASAITFVPKIADNVESENAERRPTDADPQVGDGDSMENDIHHEEASVDDGDGAIVPQEAEEGLQMDSQEISQTDLEDMAPAVTEEFTAQEEAIVSMIKSRYKLRKERRQKMNEESIQHKRVRQHFAECLQVTKDIQWTGRHRRVTFLGVVPYILACLDHFSEQATAMKRKAQKQLHGADDRTVNYDTIHERLDKIM